jgi:hypothetical protein
MATGSSTGSGRLPCLENPEQALRMKQIPEIPLVMDPQTPEAHAAITFRWNLRAGKRHKLGGAPDWIQDDDTPSCPDCAKPMTFYGQLDGIGDEIVLGDCGMIYVFFCFDCGTTQSVFQCG